MVAALLVAWNTMRAAPSISRISPLAIAPGTNTTVTFNGSNLESATALWTSFEAKAEKLKANDDSVTFSLRAVSKTVGLGAVRVVGSNGVSKLEWLLVDHLPTLPGSTTNGRPDTAHLVTAPCAIDGRVEEKASSFFRISARKAQQLTFDVVAQRIGSRLDPVVRLLTLDKRELAYCEDAPASGVDSRFTYKFETSGDYLLELRDTRYNGGSEYYYHLRIGDLRNERLALPFLASSGFQQTNSIPEVNETESTEQKPQLLPIPVLVHGRLAKPRDRDLYELKVKKGDHLRIQSKTRSLGSPCDLYLKLQTPGGKMLTESSLTGADESTLAHNFKQAGTYQLLVEDAAQQGGPEFFYQVEIVPHQDSFALSLDSDTFNTVPGGSFEMKFLPNRRGGYDGPIRISLEGAGEGFILSTNLITAKTNTANIKVTVLKDFQPAQLHLFKVKATAEDSRFTTFATVRPESRKQAPRLPSIPPALDGLLALGIRSEK